MVRLGRIVGLVAWSDLSGLSPDLGPCIRLLLWIWRRGGFRRRVWVRLHWLAADRTLRLLPSLVGRFSRPLRSCRIGPNGRPPGWIGPLHGGNQFSNLHNVLVNNRIRA